MVLAPTAAAIRVLATSVTVAPPAPSSTSPSICALADDVEIVTSAGTSKGKTGLEERLKVCAGWQNAHQVNNTQVTLAPDGKLLLEADITYQNIRSDNSKFSYTPCTTARGCNPAPTICQFLRNWSANSQGKSRSSGLNPAMQRTAASHSCTTGCTWLRPRTSTAASSGRFWRAISTCK